MELNYRLDNPARLFAAISTRKNSFVYRLCAVMLEPVDPVLLQAAVDEIYSRFPMFFVRIWKGVFWNYTDENKKPFRVAEDFSYPCSRIDIRENDGYMLRILYFGKTISVEFFHALTDCRVYLLKNSFQSYCKRMWFVL